MTTHQSNSKQDNRGSPRSPTASRALLHSSPGASAGLKAGDQQRRVSHSGAAPTAGQRLETVDETILTVDDLVAMFEVAPKTISRWRDRGLEGQSVVVDGRRRIGFLRSSVDRFIRQNPERVRPEGRFRRLTDEERGRIIEQASRLADAGASSADLVKEIAEQTGRCPDTVRSAVKRFDEQHPDQAILGGPSRLLSESAKKAVYTRYLRGDSMALLARQYNKSEHCIGRVIREKRAERIAQLPLEYMPSHEFEQSGAAEKILAPTPQAEHKQRKTRRPEGLPSYLAALYDTPLLTREPERHLFRKFNYLKFRASQLRDQLDPAQPKTRLLDEIDRLYYQAVDVKNRLIQSNLRLVVSIAKRYVSESNDLFDLVSDGNMSLIRAVEKFDYTLGNKFSTYASWAIKKNFARGFAAEFRHMERYSTSREETLSAKQEHRANPQVEHAAQHVRENHVDKLLGRLDARERRIIESRFGLNYEHEPLTLSEVAGQIGVSKERIRQIEARAIRKLREQAKDQRIELPPSRIDDD